MPLAVAYLGCYFKAPSLFGFCRLVLAYFTAISWVLVKVLPNDEAAVQTRNEEVSNRMGS